MTYNYVPKGESDASAAAAQQMVEFVNAELPGEPEHFQAHEITEPEVDAEMIDAILQPYIEKLPTVSDERDIDEDFDEEIFFKEPIVGGSAALLAHRKVKPWANKIHAVEFKFDGSGVVHERSDDGRHSRPSQAGAPNGINDRGNFWSYHHEAL